jgi:regulator of protease activity HflC (stomatin/prohibitin superfamily)
MGISGILGFVALAGWVAVVAGIGLAVASVSQGRPARNGVTLAVVGVIVGILFSIISQGVIIVQPQEVAVVFDTVRGELLEPRGPGINIVIPVIQEATYYSIAQREYTMSGVSGEGSVAGDDAVVARTSDGQEVRIDATIIYAIEPANANLIHQRWENRFQNELVRPTVRGIIRDEVSRYGVEEVYSTQREALSIGIKDAIVTRFAEEGLVVTDFLIRDIQFSADYAQSVERKQIAEQDRLRAEQEAERLRVQAQGERDAAVFQAEGDRLSAIERANGEADALRLRASAEADAILLRAEADAQALALINEQISANPNLIQWRYVDTLADNISLMLLPSDSPFLFDFETLTAGAGMEVEMPEETRATPTLDEIPSATDDAPAESETE